MGVIVNTGKTYSYCVFHKTGDVLLCDVALTQSANTTEGSTGFAEWLLDTAMCETKDVVCKDKWGEDWSSISK